MSFEALRDTFSKPEWIAPYAALASLVIARVWLRRRSTPSPLSRASADFKATGIAAGVLVVALLFSFSTPVVSSFGVPRSADQMTDPKELFRFLRMYNAELVAASMAVQWCALFSLMSLAAGVRVVREVERCLAAVPSGRTP